MWVRGVEGVGVPLVVGGVRVGVGWRGRRKMLPANVKFPRMRVKKEVIGGAVLT